MWSDDEFLQANKTMKLLMFMSEGLFPFLPEDPSIIMSDDEIINAINQFGYKSFA